MSSIASGVSFQAFDIDGAPVRGNHHESAVEYRMVTSGGEVLQTWKTARHPDKTAPVDRETPEEKRRLSKEAEAKTAEMNEGVSRPATVASIPKSEKDAETAKTTGITKL